MSSVFHALNLRIAPLFVALALTATGCPEGGDDTGDSETDSPTTGNNTSGATDDPTTGPDTSGTTGMAAELSHDLDIQPIWDANCVMACHEPAGSAASSVLLTPGEAYDGLVDKNSIAFPSLVHVVPGNRDDSYLWHKINNTQLEFGGGGSKMPLGGMLSSDDITKIGEWINQGAKP